jgi:hypothetical protein
VSRPPVLLAHSRAIPVSVEHAWDVLLPAPLERVFSRRFGALPPVRSVRDQVGVWGSAVGQFRTIMLADGGTMREELLTLRRPEEFGYRISGITGAMRPLVASIMGSWMLEPVGTGVRITWSWTLEPASRAASLAMPVFSWMWHGYARQALEEIEGLLLEA